MTIPTTTDGMLAQLLVEQGKQGTQLAVISEQLKAMPDHETRLRKLEQFRFTIVGIAVTINAAFAALTIWLGGHR